MGAPLYNVFLTNKLADDVSPALAAQRLAGLFKSTPEAMAALITGKTQLLKRGVDKNTALKYRDALQKAGCEVAFKAQTAAIVGEKPTTATQPTAGATPAAPIQTATPSGLQLAPMAGNLLRPEEHATVKPVEVETNHLSLAPVGPLPTLETAPPATPDISHLSLAAAGGELLEESEREISPVAAPDTSALSIAEVGAPIETLKSNAEPLHPDTSGLSLSPAGNDILTPAERKRPQPVAPSTDHITLAP